MPCSPGLIYPAVAYKKVELLRHLVHLVQTYPKGFAQLRRKGLWQAKILIPGLPSALLAPKHLICCASQLRRQVQDREEVVK